MTIKTAVKRDGTTQAYEPIKILRWVLWGSKGIEKAIDWQGLVQSVSSELYDGIDTQAIQLKVIEKCNSKRSSNYDLLAGRLYAAHIRKKLFNDKIPSLREHVRKLIDIGYMLDLGYSDEEYDEIDKIIDHDRDFTLKYSQVLQLYNKYALTNRVTGEKFETPQFVAMRMALALSAGEKDLMRTVRENYDMFSLFVGNAPTPNYTNLGTPHRGLISCCLYTTDDNAESLAVGDHIAYRMTCMSAGIGGYINTRSVGDPVKGGIVTHKGKMKYFKAVAAAVNANTQQCFHKDTEILTDRGFVKFTDLQDDSVVAQVHDDRSVSFTVPTARQIYPYNGPMYHIDNIDGNYELSVTPNHRLAWVRGDGYIDHTLANEFERDGKHFLTAVKAADAQPYTLSKEELMQLVNAMTVKTHRLSEGGMVHVLYSQQNKADYLYHILSNLDLAYARSYSDEMCKVIFYEDIQPINLQNKTRQQLKAYLDTFYKLLGADIVAGAPPKLVNLMQSIASLCGIHTKRHVHTEDIEFISLTGLPAELPAKDTFTTITNVDSYVCCVTVPTGNVIVRYNGSVTVSGNSRGGACTSYFTCYDPEVIDLIHLQNPRTPVKKQIRDIHFAIEFNEFFYKKLLKKEDVFLFTSYSAPELHAAFFSPDTALFERLYNELENDPTFKKTYINSTKIAVAAGRQFHETATLYSANMTEFNRHTPFLEPIYSSNLCTEIGQVTKPYKSIQDLYDEADLPGKGEISLCGLGGIVPSAIHQEPNFDKVHRETMAFTLQSDIEYFNVAYRQLKMISKCIRTNDYVFPHLKTTALNRMNAGVGMLGIAYDMAKRNFTYTSDEGIKFIHFLAERHAFMLIAASLKIGREEGNAPWINKTKWPKGWLPIDTYNKNVDTIADFQLYYPWEELRQAIIENGGIAHSCLITHMPTESCLDSATAIQTVNGPMTLKDIFELSGTTLEEAALAHEPILGGSWYDLKEPVRVLTRHGEKTVTRAWYNGQTPHAEITLESGEVIPATLGHDLLVKRDHGYSWVEVLDMRPGDVIATTSTPSTVVSVKLCDASTAHFIDIEVPDVHEYILASGVISHNSSKASGIPNAYYPVRDLHMLKTDGSNAIDFIVPEADEIGHQYQSAWLIPPLRQTQVTAVIQKFSDHSLSSDRYVDRDKMPELKASYLIDEILYDYIYGVKSRYYTNTKTTKGKKMTATTESFADEPEAGQDTSRGCDGGFCTL